MAADDPVQIPEHPASELPAPARKPWQTPRFERHDVRTSTLGNKNQAPQETSVTTGLAS